MLSLRVLQAGFLGGLLCMAIFVGVTVSSRSSSPLTAQYGGSCIPDGSPCLVLGSPGEMPCCSGAACGNNNTCPSGGGAVCGNGTVETGEDCDDGNTVDSDCCSRSCRVEAGCICQIVDASSSASVASSFVASSQDAGPCTPQNATLLYSKTINPSSSAHAGTSYKNGNTLDAGEYVVEYDSGSWSAWPTDSDPLADGRPWHGYLDIVAPTNGTFMESRLGREHFTTANAAENYAQGKFLVVTLDHSASDNLFVYFEDHNTTDNRGQVTYNVYQCSVQGSSTSSSASSFAASSQGYCPACAAACLGGSSVRSLSSVSAISLSSEGSIYRPPLFSLPSSGASFSQIITLPGEQTGGGGWWNNIFRSIFGFKERAISLMAQVGGSGALGCDDTDGGNNLAVKGTVILHIQPPGSDLSYTDRCNSATEIIENYCDVSGRDIWFVPQPCPAGMTCSDGACTRSSGSIGSSGSSTTFMCADCVAQKCVSRCFPTGSSISSFSSSRSSSPVSSLSSSRSSIILLSSSAISSSSAVFSSSLSSWGGSSSLATSSILGSAEGQSSSRSDVGSSSALLSCSDGLDNDSDRAVDGADPGCHRDLDVGNPASYDPNDDDERDTFLSSHYSSRGGPILPECADNRDNDGDGTIDGADPGCHTDLDPGNPLSFDPFRKEEEGGIPDDPAMFAVGCGDGNLKTTEEECDDGNRRDFDGCTSDCRLEIGVCGDGIVQTLLGEECEPPLFDPAAPSSCRECKVISRFCGNESIDGGEECDNGRENSIAPGARCRPNCHLPRCGDGIKDSWELCDDGNRVGGDGCDRYCFTEEQHFTSPSVPLYGAVPPPVELPGNVPIFPPYAVEHPWLPQQPKTGPEILAVMAAGAAGGWAWMRRKARPRTSAQ